MFSLRTPKCIKFGWNLGNFKIHVIFFIAARDRPGENSKAKNISKLCKKLQPNAHLKRHSL